MKTLIALALCFSLAALALAGYATYAAATQDADSHRCGDAGGGLFTCLEGDTPKSYAARGCIIASTEGRVTYWQCRG